MYANSNPILFSDPLGLFTIEQIVQGFGLDNMDQVINLFEPGGVLQGKWGYLKFLEQAWGNRGPYSVWRENDFQDFDPSYGDLDRRDDNSVIWRPDIECYPCEKLPWYAQPGRGCYSGADLLTRGYFTNFPGTPPNPPTWVDGTTGTRMNLMDLGLMDATWYFGNQEYYAYAKYKTLVGTDLTQIDMFSLSSNVSNLIGPGLITFCVATEGAGCIAVGIVLVIYGTASGWMNTTSTLDKMDLGDGEAFGDFLLDACSNVPGLGLLCQLRSIGKDIEDANIYIGDE